MRAVLTLTDAAYYLRLRERQLIDLAHQGKMPHRKVGKEFYFDQAELDAWWDAQPGQKHPATLPATPSVTKGHLRSPDDTNAPVIALVKGAKGRNRERLADGERR